MGGCIHLQVGFYLKFSKGYGNPLWHRRLLCPQYTKKHGGQGKVIRVFNVDTYTQNLTSLKNKCCELAKLKSDCEGVPLIPRVKK